MNLAICYRKQRRPQEAADALRDAIERLEALKADYPRTPIFAQELARAIYELGMVNGEQGKLPEAQVEFAKAVQLQEQLLAKQPQLAAVRLQLAQSLISLGIALVGLEKMDEALADYRKGVDLLEQTKPSAEAAPEVCNELARGQENLAKLLTFMKKPLEADQSWGRLLELRVELAKAFPEALDKQGDLAATQVQFATRFQKHRSDDSLERRGGGVRPVHAAGRQGHDP
jgi:tetratricopeptide (TPR) repeat protein